MLKLKNEDKHLEYKEAKRALPKDFWETYSSFSNTEGGYIILGISNDLTIVGVEDTIKVRNELFTSLNNPNKVNRNLLSDSNVVVRTIGDKEIIEVQVPEAKASQKPIYINQNPKQTWIRDFETDRKATEEELKAMLRNARDDIDSDLIDGFDIHDLDLESLNEYRIILSKTDERYLKMSDTELLVEVGAFKRDRNILDSVNYKMTLGGLLFFGKYTSITSADSLQHFHLDYFNYINVKERWKDRVASGEPGFQNINVFSFYRIVLNKLIATIDTNFSLSDDLLRENYTRDLEITLREALANSLIHADYFSEESVKIEAFSTHYKFFNPGKMKISVEEFANGGTPKPRNHTITNLFRKIGVSERAGSGGPQIFSTAKKHRLNLPEIDLGNNSTTLQIWKVDIAEAHPELSEFEKSILKLLTKEMLPQSSKFIREKLDLSKHHFDKSIKNLIKLDLIEQQGQGKATKYSLKANTIEHLTSLQQMFNKLQNYYLNQNK